MTILFNNEISLYFTYETKAVLMRESLNHSFNQFIQMADSIRHEVTAFLNE